MPWSEKQQAVARAVEHGWKPMGSAKGFTKSFAAKVLDETRGKDLRRLSRRKRKKAKD